MPKKNNTRLEKLAEWRGGINQTLKELNKNQDELDKNIKEVLKLHTKCREEVVSKLAVLQEQAKQAGKRWGLLYGAVAGVVVSVISGIIMFFIAR